MNHMGLHLSLPCTMAAVAVARDTVSGTLRGWGRTDQGWLDMVELIVTELVSNAVRHADGWLAFDLRTNGRTVVTVTDDSPALPRLNTAKERGGHGLLIVEALCLHWGFREHGPGKEVWAELPPYPNSSRPLSSP